MQGVDDNGLTGEGRLLNTGGRVIDGPICGSGVVCWLQIYAHGLATHPTSTFTICGIGEDKNTRYAQNKHWHKNVLKNFLSFTSPPSNSESRSYFELRNPAHNCF